MRSIIQCRATGWKENLFFVVHRLFAILCKAPKAVKPAFPIAAAFLLGLCSAGAQPQPGTLLWSTNFGDWIVGSPALSLDNTLYVRTASGLYALRPQASGVSTKWFFTNTLSHLAGSMTLTPAIAADGTVYMPGADGDGPAIFAVNPDGSRKWSYPV